MFYMGPSWVPTDIFAWAGSSLKRAPHMKKKKQKVEKVGKKLPWSKENFVDFPEGASAYTLGRQKEGAPAGAHRDHYTVDNIKTLEEAQRRSARFVCNQYSHDHNVHHSALHPC